MHRRSTPAPATDRASVLPSVGTSIALRRLALREQFRFVADAIAQRRAHVIPESFIEDYVALDWLQWRGGALRLTATGRNLLRQRPTH